jgi:hypothetical protein
MNALGRGIEVVDVVKPSVNEVKVDVTDWANTMS